MNFAIDVGATLASLHIALEAYSSNLTLLGVGCLAVALFFIFSGIWDLVSNFRE